MNYDDRAVVEYAERRLRAARLQKLGFRLLRNPAQQWIGTLRSLCLAALSLATPLYSQTADIFNPSMDGTPLGFAVQTDSKILVIGNFSNIAGQTRYNNSRLNSDGTFDWTFFASGAVNPIMAVGLATNGDVFFGGQFVRFGGVDRPYLIRVTSSGGVGIFSTWPNGPVRAVAIQSDGKLLAGGDFTSIGGVARNCLARLNADNSVDSTFNPAANNSVYSLALQTDGKILVGGAFTGIAGAARTNLVRLNSDGTLDPSFDAAALGVPNVLLVQADGEILVGGDYLNTPAGVNYCRRLKANGSLDTAFNPVLTHTNPSVYALALQTDGSILVGGIFDTLGGVSRANLGRLSQDGSTDLTFNPSVGFVYSLALQPDGRLLFGSPGHLGRLLNTDPATNNLFFDNSSVTWTRGGTAPEVWSVTFEITTNGVDWLNLAQGARIVGGWQSSGLSLPSAPAIIRARGFVTGGSWFDEKFAGPPIITGEPAGATRNASASVTFSASVTGPALVYQWLKNGASFYPGNGSGAQSPSLTLTNLLAADAGQYQLVVSNSWGSVTSQVANLVVIDPALTSQPVGVFTNIGRIVNFFVGVGGTQPLSYQWFKNGVALPNATAPSLTLTNVQPSDAANYFAIITNQYGMRTSSVAPLVISQVAVWGYSANGAGNFPAGLTNITAISGGATHAGGWMALRSDGVVIAWPSAGWGGGSNFIAIAAGYYLNLALKSDGTVSYDFGAGLKPSGFSNVVAIAQYNYNNDSGAWASLILRADGSLDGSAGLPGLSNLVAISQGFNYSLGLRADGTVVGWGNNAYGQTNTPPGLSNVMAIAAGYYHSLALKEDGTVLAWGRNVEQQTNVPPALSDVVAIAAGGYHSMALKSDGTVVAWGANNYGQTNVPAWLTNVSAIAAGQYHSLALQGSGLPVIHAALTNATIGTNGFQVSAPSQSGRVFILQYKNSPTDIGWVSAPLVAGNGGVLVLTDLTVTNSSQRLYRVIRR